jgi:hypothetical protein
MKFKLTNITEDVQFSEAKKYTISIIGGFKVKQTGNFKITLVHKTSNEKIEIKEGRFKITTLWDFKRAIKFYDFVITETGVYELSFANITELKLQKSQLRITSWLFSRIIKLENIEIGID